MFMFYLIILHATVATSPLSPMSFHLDARDRPLIQPFVATPCPLPRLAAGQRRVGVVGSSAGSGATRAIYPLPRATSAATPGLAWPALLFTAPAAHPSRLPAARKRRCEPRGEIKTPRWAGRGVSWIGCSGRVRRPWPRCDGGDSRADVVVAGRGVVLLDDGEDVGGERPEVVDAAADAVPVAAAGPRLAADRLVVRDGAGAERGAGPRLNGQAASQAVAAVGAVATLATLREVVVEGAAGQGEGGVVVRQLPQK